MKEDTWFQEWESTIFGACYGTGEMPILKAVKEFFANLQDGRSYDYETLERKLGDTVTWLLINAFDKANMIEWGTSARYGWLTSSGELLKEYMDKKTTEELYEIIMHREAICMCNGEMEGHDECGKNPFINEKLADKIKYSSK